LVYFLIFLLQLPAAASFLSFGIPLSRKLHLVHFLSLLLLLGYYLLLSLSSFSSLENLISIGGKAFTSHGA
jgi:hypothetical protein